MYHYVRPESKEYPDLNSLNIDTFRRQLDYFEQRYGFLSKSEYQDAVRKGKNPKGAVLTFDDGLKDHVKYVLPELQERGLWGLFYISTGVYQTNQLLGVHRVHYLKGKYGAKTILDVALQNIDSNMLEHDTIDEFDAEIYTNSTYEENEKKLKRLFNYYISYKYRDTILDGLMDSFFDNEKELFKKVYLSVRDIEKLISNGNIIGSHSISHRVMSRLSFQEQYREVRASFDFLDDINRQNYKSFCYPYGYKSSYNSDTLKVLKVLNIDDACIFDNQIQSGKVRRYELSRIDCNQFLRV
ncbi:polysaccharide deacetylase family protein [Gammaproteobacteria bacterium]|nr:polysaccharide deacetylase family protein [Gammaproteobacteria bacterium]